MKSNIFLLMIIGLLFTTACEDFLEEKTYSQLTPELLYTSPENAQLAVNGLYIAHFEERYGQQMFWPAFWGTKNQEFSNFAENNAYDLKWTSGENLMYWHWRALYKAINACNSAIDGIEGMSSDIITEEQRNLLVAESKFMRAHGYYHLLKFWGGVPVLTEPTQNPEKASKARDNAQTVFDQIEEDLKFAQQYLPVNWAGGFPDVGRCTKGAATARLAQLYCIASGEQFKGNDPVNGDADFNNLGTYWNEARVELAKMIDESDPSQAKAPYMYSLEEDLALLYTGGTDASGSWVPVREANNWGKEIIWATNYNPDIHDGTWLFNHWANRYISPYLLEKFAPGGYRAEIKHDSVTKANLGRIVSAHIKRNRTGNDNKNQFYFARYAGMVTLMAYVENEINNGPTQLAENCLNVIRARARNGNGTVTYDVPADIASGLSYSDFKDAVMYERYVEFFGEEIFWNDVWMSGHMERDWDNISSGPDGNRGSYDKRWKLFPIPERELITAGGLLVQNPGH